MPPPVGRKYKFLCINVYIHICLWFVKVSDSKESHELHRNRLPAPSAPECPQCSSVAMSPRGVGQTFSLPFRHSLPSPHPRSASSGPPNVHFALSCGEDEPDWGRLPQAIGSALATAFDAGGCPSEASADSGGDVWACLPPPPPVSQRSATLVTPATVTITRFCGLTGGRGGQAFGPSLC